MRTTLSALVGLSVLLGSSLAAAAPSTLVINEFLANPAGADDGFEWVELYNSGADLDLGGYKLQAATSGTPTDKATVPAGTTLKHGAFYVFAGSSVVVPDGVGHTAIGDSVLGNNSSGADLVRLVKADGTAVDTVVYGSPNSDNFVDDTGAVALSTAPKSFSGESNARTVDGVDTDASSADFSNTTTPTLGAPNQVTVFVPDAGAPDGSAPDASVPDAGGSSSSGGTSSSSGDVSSSSSSGDVSSSSGGKSSSSSSSGGKSSSSGGKSSSSGGKSSSSGGKDAGAGSSGSGSGDDDDAATTDDGGCNTSPGGSSLGLVLGLGALVALARRRRQH